MLMVDTVDMYPTSSAPWAIRRPMLRSESNAIIAGRYRKVREAFPVDHMGDADGRHRRHVSHQQRAMGDTPTDAQIGIERDHSRPIPESPRGLPCGSHGRC